MGRKWTTKEQETFLCGWGARYKEASAKKSYLVLWDELYAAWFLMFPEPVPDRLMQIAPELWSKEEQEQAQKNILRRKAQLKDWCRNRFRVDCRVESTNLLEKLVNKTCHNEHGKRAKKETELFSGRYYQGSATQATVQQRLKDEAPRDELGEPMKETKAEKSLRRMKIYGVEIEKAWKNATMEQKDDVQAIREAIRDRNEEEEGDEEANEAVDIHAEGLRQLPKLMDAAAKAMNDISGWNFTILCGGRGAAGQVQTASYHLGKTKNGNNFFKAFPDFNNSIMRPWAAFVRNVCEAVGEPAGPLGACASEVNGCITQVPTDGFQTDGLSLYRFSATPEETGLERPDSLEGPTQVNDPDATPQENENEPAPDVNANSGGSTGSRTSTLTQPVNDATPQENENEPAPDVNANNGGSTGSRTSTLTQPVNDATPQENENEPAPDVNANNGGSTGSRTSTLTQPVNNATPEENRTLSRETEGPNSVDTAWLTGALERLRTTEGLDWKEAVDIWAKMEQAESASKKPQRFSTTDRPPQVARWFAYGRSYTTDPSIPDIEEYETSVLAWWLFLQPEWRKSAGPLPLPLYDAPEGHTWGTLNLTGPHGLLVVMMSFAWWGTAVSESPLWLAASADLKRALKAMRAERNETRPQPSGLGTKRTRPADKENTRHIQPKRGRRSAAPISTPPRKTRSMASRR